jgi:hypothetical protein
VRRLDLDLHLWLVHSLSYMNFQFTGRHFEFYDCVLVISNSESGFGVGDRGSESGIGVRCRGSGFGFWDRGSGICDSHRANQTRKYKVING